MTAPVETLSSAKSIPKGVWALGFVSLFMDASSELIHSLMPIFLVSVLGASALTVGLISGLAEAVVSITKLFSGGLSDWLGRRKPLILAGYGLAALTKPILPLAPSVAWVFAAHVVDRFGKGVRGAPRDALVADLTPPQLRGTAYGLRQSIDTVGAFLGPLLAILFMALLDGDIRAVFWIAVVPAVISVVIILVFVREAERPVASAKPKLRLRDAMRLETAFWLLLVVAGVFTLARFSEAFLVLRASDAGLSATFVPLVMVVMSVAYAASSYPAGVLSDRMARNRVFAAGIGLLIAADGVLAAAGGSVTLALLGVALWGLHMGFTQGLLAAMIADKAPADLRGTAFGLFNLAIGLVTLLASLMAGLLWEQVAPWATFAAGGGFAVLTLLLLPLVGEREEKAGSRRAT
jgi:MFS family permease